MAEFHEADQVRAALVLCEGPVENATCARIVVVGN
jgi:hypothetical protein